MQESTEKGPLEGMCFGRDGRIQVGRMLGQGSIGSVYKAWDTEQSRDVAMKFLRRDYVRDPELVERFEREGKRFARLRHENILKVFGLGRGKGETFIVTEFVPGRNLGVILRSDGAYEVNRGLQVAREIALALKAAHEDKVVHRDLKPENVMIREPDGLVKVLDFGIAKSLDTQSSFTRPGTYLGTPGYSSPEQIHGRGVDHRADIFSLGAMLYEILTGKLAFKGRHTTQVLRSTLRDQPIPTTRFNDTIATPVAKLIERMIHKHPGRRPESMDDVIQAIDEVGESLARGYEQQERGGLVNTLKRVFQA